MDCRKTDWSDKESFLDIMAPLTELRGGRRPSKVGGTPGTARKDGSGDEGERGTGGLG